MLEETLDRGREESKAREEYSSATMNEINSSGTASIGSMNQLQSIEGWLSARENFRVVSEEFPRQLPLFSVLSWNQALTDYHETRIKPHIPTILRNHHLAYRFFGLHTRRNPGVVESTEKELETLLIDTHSKDSSNWKAAAVECANLYYVGGYGPSEIEVEIHTSREVHCNISQVLGDDSEVLEALRQVGPAMMEEVRHFCPNGWSSMAFHGRSRLGELGGKAVPTVLVFIRKGFWADFDKLEHHLLHILDGLRVSIELEILIGSITTASRVHAKALTYWEVPPEQPTNGYSIGVRGNTEEAGTLGGWL